MLALLKARANANVQDELFGETPLHKALIRGMHDSALCLLSKSGAWVNVPDARGDTALHTAARHCHVMAVWTALLKTRPNKAVGTTRVRRMRSMYDVFSACAKRYRHDACKTCIRALSCTM